MLRLNAQYSKKVPAEQDYSSRGYAAEISIELPDNLTQEELQQRIHNTFAMVETAVENEINKAQNHLASTEATPAVPQAQVPLASHEANSFTPVQPPVTERSGEQVSPKQLKYLTDLLRETRHDASVFLQSRGLKTIYELSRVQCSQLIDLIKEQHSKAA